MTCPQNWSFLSPSALYPLNDFTQRKWRDKTQAGAFRRNSIHGWIPFRRRTFGGRLPLALVARVLFDGASGSWLRRCIWHSDDCWLLTLTTAACSLVALLAYLDFIWTMLDLSFIDIHCFDWLPILTCDCFFLPSARAVTSSSLFSSPKVSRVFFQVNRCLKVGLCSIEAWLRRRLSGSFIF